MTYIESRVRMLVTHEIGPVRIVQSGLLLQQRSPVLPKAVERQLVFPVKVHLNVRRRRRQCIGTLATSINHKGGTCSPIYPIFPKRSWNRSVAYSTDHISPVGRPSLSQREKIGSSFHSALTRKSRSASVSSPESRIELACPKNEGRKSHGRETYRKSSLSSRGPPKLRRTHPR